jgi:hypothetical protein
MAHAPTRYRIDATAMGAWPSGRVRITGLSLPPTPSGSA